MLNEDLVRVAQLNISKSQFMLIGGPKKLPSFSEVTLTICEKTLDRVNTYNYLGVIIS